MVICFFLILLCGFELVGRQKSMINSAGRAIVPDEVDEALFAHSAVKGAVTVGIPNDEFGEIPVSAVELDGPLEMNVLVSHLQERLEPNLGPKHIVHLDEIPRGISGKPNQPKLIELISQALETGRATSKTDATKQDVTSRIIEVAAQVFRCDRSELSPNSHVDSIAGWDSFSHLSLVLAIEEEFDVHLPARHITGIRSLKDAANLMSTL